MNLLIDPWIPVRCLSGQPRMISPPELADTHDPPIELDAIRPDFNGALAQFLIGLLQWLAPARESDWRKVAEGRAEPDWARLRELTACFEFDSGDHRFMQDMHFEPAEAGDMSGLLLEAPGGNTVKNNADLFIKRRGAMVLSLPLAAQALLTLQINAPAGGQGHRTSLRGGGPVSMLLWPPHINGQPLPLWRKLWVNTLVLDGDEPRPQVIFPWMAECLTSEGDRNARTLLDPLSPSKKELAILCSFATPRRIRLGFDDDATCALTDTKGRCATAFETRNFGANYRSDLFRHPLSPYYRDKNGSFLPVHIGANGFTYADWILTQEESGHFLAPLSLDGHRLGGSLRRQIPADSIWAFAYAMDNMKCLAWHETRFPHLVIEDEAARSAVLLEAKQWIAAAEHVRRALGKQLRAAWSGQGKGDTSVAERELYARTERQFYSLLNDLGAMPDMEDAAHNSARQDWRRRWQRHLATTALALFQEQAEQGDVASESMQSIERSSFAHRALLKAVHGELKDVLELDVAERAAKKSAGKRRKAA